MIIIVYFSHITTFAAGCTMPRRFDAQPDEPVECAAFAGCG